MKPTQTYMVLRAAKNTQHLLSIVPVEFTQTDILRHSQQTSPIDSQQ
ncbi:MAG: hypothetical protein MUE44_26600 [Oscillatoriaceae cyanobacterium Prado104]|nr:hypothetical protein [Oscillatoriaceae cyanobacterium Prado104]